MKLLLLSFCFSIISLPFHIFATHEKSPEGLPSNVRQFDTEAPNLDSELSPELQEFKREFLAALEIPEAVQVLYSLFEFLSTPLDLPPQVPENAELDKQCKVTDSERCRQLGEDGTDGLSPKVSSNVQFVNSLLSMDEHIKKAETSGEAVEDSVAKRIRRLQALKEIRRRAGEITGNILHGPQPALMKLFTPQRGPVETILFGRGGRRSIF